MSRFLEALHSGRVLLMDGAMGTELQKLGLKDDENTATWNRLHPEQVTQVHRAYLDAGADVILTNTFMINAGSYSATLREAGVEWILGWGDWLQPFDLIPPVARFRLAAIGPVAGPTTSREFDRLKDCFAPGDECGNILPHECRHVPDGVLVETCSSPRVRHVIRRLQRWNKRPFLLSLTYLRNDRGQLVTYSGHTPEWFAERAEKWGLAALGVNCGRDIDMDDTIEIIRRYRAVTDLSLFARPNAGTPKRKGKRWVYPHTPKQMAERLPELLEAGVSMVGGCCGTTPEHIAAFREVVDKWNESMTSPKRKRG